MVAAVSADPEAAPLGARSRALVDYAIKLTRMPAAITEADIASVREQGFSDRGVHDLACVVAYFNYVNRLADGLGVELEG